MVELALTNKEADAVLEALARKSSDLEANFRYRNGSKEDGKRAELMQNIMKRIYLQLD